MAKVFPIIKLSPSNSGHWLNCAGYAQGCAKAELVDSTSEAAELGTAAHKLLELCMRLGEWDASKLETAIMNGYGVDDDMFEAVQEMLNWVRTWITDRVFEDMRVYSEMEVSLDLAGYGLTGTADIVLYDRSSGELVVLDYKHGSGVWVDADGNTQVGLYILAVLELLRSEGLPVKSISGVICQPRYGGENSERIRKWIPTAPDLRSLLARAVEAVNLAQQPDPRRTAGSHCKWCPLAATCRELAEYNLRTAMVDFEDINLRPVIDPLDPQSLTPDGMAYVLHHLPTIEGWVKAVKEEAHTRMLRQRPVPGYKLVAGRRMRVWANDEQVKKLLLDEGFSVDDVAPRSLLGPAPVTKMVRKNKDLLKRVNGLIVKSKPTISIAPEADPRPAINSTAALVFKPIEDNE